MLRSTLQKYAAMQQLAADTMQFIQNHIQVGQTADQIKTLCETYMLAHGAQSFWYYDVGALVFHHPDTLLSVSGREYVPAHTCIQSNDMITIDLSPQRRRIWGDFAGHLLCKMGR